MGKKPLPGLSQGQVVIPEQSWLKLGTGGVCDPSSPDHRDAAGVGGRQATRPVSPCPSSLPWSPYGPSPLPGGPQAARRLGPPSSEIPQKKESCPPSPPALSSGLAWSQVISGRREPRVRWLVSGQGAVVGRGPTVSRRIVRAERRGSPRKARGAVTLKLGGEGRRHAGYLGSTDDR